VKRERGAEGGGGEEEEEEEYVPKSATAADRVDLTEEVSDSLSICKLLHY
jgi:hypothetical protein